MRLGVLNPLRRLGLAVGVLLLFGAQSVFSAEYYDEIKDENGRVYSHYRGPYEAWAKTPPAARERFLKQSRKAFQGDNAMDAMPRVISQHEFENILRPGVQQRAAALRAFLKDHYSGKKRYLKDGIISPGVIENILPRSDDHLYQGMINPEIVAFLYGPDILRDSDGTFRVIEDNPGYVGGMGDLLLAHRLAMERYPQLKKYTKYQNPSAFYNALALSFIREAKKKDGVAVMYMTAPFPDNEDPRLRKILSDLGIQTVTQNSRMQLEVRDDGVYVFDSQKARARREKVGFLYMNGEYWWLDPSHPKNREALVVKETQAHLGEDTLLPEVRKKLETALQRLRAGETDTSELERILRRSNFLNDVPKNVRTARMATGLTEAILAGKVGANYVPGMDFVGDKEFYLYVEDLIRYYLKQEPILKNIPTRRFAVGATGKLDAKVFREAFASLGKYVVKKTDGRGGDSVWIGNKLKAAEVRDLKKRIEDNPSAYIVQEFTALSRVNDNIVDLRLFTQVLSDELIIANVPWGRGVPVSGNGKVNLSALGREFVILVPQSCADLLH